MNVLIEDEFNWLKDKNIKSKLIEGIIKESLLEQDFSKKVEISLILTKDNYIKELNNQHRNINKETDVLSFPQINWEDESNDINYRNELMDYILLGDIIISTERLEAQAKEYGHSIERELGFLLVHSMLHLLGYDHLSKEEENIMLAKQKAILEKLGLKR